jgi:hypothetical protein
MFKSRKAGYRDCSSKEITVMAEDLNHLLRTLYDAGAENVPASEIDWHQDQTPILLMALSMGYLRYRERAGIRYFYLTNAGYDAIGAERMTFSPFGPLSRWFRSLSG